MPEPLNTIKHNTTINILLADDDRDDRELFGKALKEIPIPTSLKTVNHGEELMDYLLANSNDLPDVLFLDLSMPRKTGFECLVEIKENKKLKGFPVIVYTTSFSRGIDLEMQLSNILSNQGAQGYIRKPDGFKPLIEVIHKELIRIIEKPDLTTGKKNRIKTGPINAAVSLKQMNILLADDDIDDISFFKKALEMVPLVTHLKTVSDGEELMKYLLENSENLPHLLFLDINMPKKNGHECLIEIKKNEKLKDLPVVMYSTAKEPDTISTLFKAGAVIYIHKPSDFTELVQVILHALPIASENIFSNGKLKCTFNS